MGADDLIANGKEVAIIDYHTSDVYANSYSESRLSYYGLQGTPTAWFDGGSAVAGGDHTTSMYPYYLPKYNQRISVPSYFSMEMEGSNSGMIDYGLNFTIEKDAEAPVSDLVLHVVVTESDIQVNWQGMTEVNHVERLMAPNQYGTPLDFSGGDILELSVSFSMNPDWVSENCEVIAFIQNTQTKVVQQAIMADIMDFGTTNENDATILSVVAPSSVCKENFTPKVEIANYGLDNLTSLDIVYQVNSESSETYTWTGDLAYMETDVIVLPEVSFTLENSNVFVVEAENPNGEEDQYPSNNTVTKNMADAANVPSTISLVLKLDNNPEETSWEVLNSEGTVLYSGGSYTIPGQQYIETFEFTDPDCYAFIIYDEGGDGLTGAGNYKLAYDGTPPTYFAEGKYFGYEKQDQFGVGLTGEVEILSGNGIEVYPNPTDQKAVVSFELMESQPVVIVVFNAMGEIVQSYDQKVMSSGKHTLTFDGEGLNSGIYYLNLKIGENTKVQKLIIK